MRQVPCRLTAISAVRCTGSRLPQLAQGRLLPLRSELIPPHGTAAVWATGWEQRVH